MTSKDTSTGYPIEFPQMARAGYLGPLNPGPVATGPREFPLVKRVDPGTSVEGGSQPDAGSETDVQRLGYPEFGYVETQPYGGEPGGIVVMPDDYFSFANALNGDNTDTGNRNWLKEDDWRDEPSASVAWKWSLIYDLLQATEVHPHIVPFRGIDPWTGFAVLKKPNGPSLAQFLGKNAARLYAGSSRLQTKYLPLAYQWALELLSALAFLHQHHISIGEIEDGSCWLSEPSLSLTLMGFSSAAVRSSSGYVRYLGDLSRGSVSYHNIKDRNPTPTTDLHVWGCVGFQIMTRSWPGTASPPGTPFFKHGMSNFVSLPQLPSGHLGNIIRRVWDDDIADAGSLQQELIAELGRQGWETQGRHQDKLAGFSATDLFTESS